MANPIDWLKGKSKRGPPRATVESVPQQILQLPGGEPQMPSSGKVPSTSNRAYYDRAIRAEEEAQRVKQEAIDQVNARTEAIKLQTERAKRSEADASAWRQFGAERGKTETYEDYFRRTGKTAPGQQPNESTEEYRARVIREEQESSKRRGAPTNPSSEDLLSRLNPRERSKEEKKLRQAAEADAKSRLEAQRAGVSPMSEPKYMREWINSFVVKKGETYKDPNTGSVYNEGQTVPGHHVIITIPGNPLSPMELNLKTAIQIEQLKQIKGPSRKRRVATGLANFGMAAAVNITGAAVQGTAGIARGMQPGRGGPQRAVRMTVPTGANDLFRVNRPNVDLSSLRNITRPRTPNPGVRPSTMAAPRQRTYNPAQGRVPTPMMKPSMPNIKKWRLF